MIELWRTLKDGDHIRLISWPAELLRDRLHSETIDFYEWLIRTGEVLTVSIDADGLPWGNWEGIVDGRWKSEGTLLNHGGIERVLNDARP